MAFLLGFFVLFSGGVQANPTLAAQYLQQTKDHFQLTKAYYEVGRTYSIAGNATAAVIYFQSAYTGALRITASANDLYRENLDTLSRGQYRNLQYQQLAVSYSDQLRAQAKTLSVYLSILIQSPLSSTARLNVETKVMQITQLLLQLEQAMRLAQA
ncbi:MAG: hypothetical protein E6Q88_02730 [Lysobacteraceae bacterium]|nr:MAG: hypothetical protein E6Q88_02730 [Xanthomonadaceae bacterium]